MRHYFLYDARTGEHRVSWHAQNLNERFVNGQRLLGPMWQHGRAWFRAFGFTVHPSWFLSLRRHHIGLRVEVGREDDLAFHIGLPCVSLWLSVECQALRRLCSRIGHREISVRVHGGSLWWVLGIDDSERRYPRSFLDKVKAGSFDPIRFLFGRDSYERTTLSVAEAIVPLPEANYPCTIVFDRATWARPRWPWWPLTRRRYGSTLTLDREHPIPVPGKGENSWDCDEDAFYSLSSGETTVAGAVANAVKRSLETRRRYGGRNWQPEKVA